jgi:hypothetical protein
MPRSSTVTLGQKAIVPKAPPSHTQDSAGVNQWDPIRGKDRALRAHQTVLRPTEWPSNDLEQAFRPTSRHKQRLGGYPCTTAEASDSHSIPNQDLGSIYHPSKASGATPGWCARAHPLEKSNTRTSRGPSNLARSLATSIPDAQPMEEYHYSLTVSGVTVGYHN